MCNYVGDDRCGRSPDRLSGRLHAFAWNRRGPMRAILNLSASFNEDLEKFKRETGGW